MERERARREGNPKVGIRRPGRRTNAPVFVVRHESTVVGVPCKLRPQARGCTPREQGFTIRCFVDPGKPPCQGPPRPIMLTPAQPSRPPETRDLGRAVLLPLAGLETLWTPFVPCSRFPLPFSLVRRRIHPWPSVVGVATLDRFAHRLHQSHPRMQSLPHCRVSTPVVSLPSKRVVRERVYVCVWYMLVE